MSRWTPKRIKALRRRLGMSQSEFAQAHHLNVRTLQNWEGGRPVSRYASMVLEQAAASDR